MTVTHDDHDSPSDPTFYRTPTDAISAPPERLAYVVGFDRAGAQPDALTVVDTDPASSTYGEVVGFSELPTRGDELPCVTPDTAGTRVRSGATCSCRACVPRGSMCSTPSRIRPIPSW